jgi:cell wall assembly regulator SMI1
MSLGSSAVVREAWNRIETWCRQRHPRLLGRLSPGASKTDLDILESVFGCSLPDEVRSSLYAHNGQREEGGFLFGQLDLFSTTDISREWQHWLDCQFMNEEFQEHSSSIPEQAVALDYANSGWIPLAGDLSGNYLGVDLAPGPAGSRGQVINFGRDEQQKCVINANWSEFLSGYANFLESLSLTELNPTPAVWRETLSAQVGNQHILDLLATWRQEGRWPPAD